ncbi:MAG: hypothetical protein ABF649_04245 [Bacillus sp. (in: firmicutes)]
MTAAELSKITGLAKDKFKEGKVVRVNADDFPTLIIKVEERKQIAMLNKIEEIKQALKCECYLPALALALTLPDICGQIEYHQFVNKKGNRLFGKQYKAGLTIGLITGLQILMVIQKKVIGRITPFLQVKCVIS